MWIIFDERWIRFKNAYETEKVQRSISVLLVFFSFGAVESIDTKIGSMLMFGQVNRMFPIRVVSRRLTVVESK